MLFQVQKKAAPKLNINVGALMDIPTGVMITGARGETIINGGAGAITGVVGPGNIGKSTILHYIMLSAANKVTYSTPTGLHTYDTEVNVMPERLEKLAHRHKYLPHDLVTSEEPRWTIADKTSYYGNEWATLMKNNTNAKIKDKKNFVKWTALKAPNSKDMLETPIPTFIEIDSISEFEGSSTIDMLSKDLDDSSTNTIFMKQGALKTKFLAELPRISNNTNSRFGITAHIGKEINMDANKYNVPTKKLQYLKKGDELKGVSTKFFFLLNNAWSATSSSVLKNPTTKVAEYPVSNKDSATTELTVVKMTQLRGKSGQSGFTIEVVISQDEGLLEDLTNFHYIKSNDRFGISGSPVHYHLDLLPDVNLSRTTIRSKLDTDERVRRATEMTADLLQLDMFFPRLRDEGLWCDPKTLYEDIKAMGYDWELLYKSRNWLTPNQYGVEIPFLSTVDLLKMRAGQYKPYWYKGEIKKIDLGDKKDEK